MNVSVVIDSSKLNKLITRALKEIPETTTNAIKKSAMNIERAAKRTCTAVDTGWLRAHIEATTRDNWMNADIGTFVKYAPYVEFGTGIYAKDGTGRRTPWSWYSPRGKYKGWHFTHGMRPQPFLFPSWEAERPLLISSLTKAIKDNVDKLERA